MASLDVKERRSRAAPAENARHPSAEQRLLLVEAAYAEGHPASAEGLIDRDTGVAVGRTRRAGLHFLPDIAGFAGEGDSRAAELVAHGHAVAPLCGEARIAGNVAGD